MNSPNPVAKLGSAWVDSSGFTLAEFLVASTILLIISAPLFGSLNSIQKAASEQAEIQQIQDNMRVALQTAMRCIRGAGNDPFAAGFERVSPISETEVRIRSDLTGSEAPGRPDKGDPDGDIMDSGEDILLRYNNPRQRLEMVRGTGPAQIVADNISGFAIQYLNADGEPAPDGTNVRTIRIRIRGTASGSIGPAQMPLTLERTGTVRILP